MMSHPVTVVAVVYGKVALIVPAAMLTEAGTCNPVLDDLSDTAVVVPAWPEMATVQVPEPPGWTDLGLQVKAVNVDTAAPATNDNVAVALPDP